MEILYCADTTFLLDAVARDHQSVVEKNKIACKRRGNSFMMASFPPNNAMRYS